MEDLWNRFIPTPRRTNWDLFACVIIGRLGCLISFVFLVFIVLIVSAAYFIFTDCPPPLYLTLKEGDGREFGKLLVTLAGSVLTLLGVLTAFEAAKRGWKYNALAKLHDLESQPEQQDAKELIYGFKGNINEDDSAATYNSFRSRINELCGGQARKVDHARRRITHFWYTCSSLG